MLNSRKIVFWYGVIATVFFIGTMLLTTSRYCGSTDWCLKLIYFGIYDALFLLFFTAPPMLLFSVITHFLRPEVFNSWIKFSAWYIPIAFVLSFVFGQGGGSWITVGPEPQGVFMLLMAVYSLISLLIVSYKALRGRAV